MSKRESAKSNATAAPSPACPAGRNLLAGKTVLVTAAAGTGIGYATAKRCAEEGALVILSDRHARRLEEHADELQALTGQSVPRIACDVTVGEEVEAMVQYAIDQASGQINSCRHRSS